MPAAIFVSTLVGLTATQLAVALFIAGIVDSYILGAILAPSDFGSTQQLAKQTLVIKSSSEAHKVIYGRTMVGGTLVFIDVLDRYHLSPRTGTTSVSCAAGNNLTEKRVNNKYLNMAVAIAAHEIDAIEQIWIGDTLAFELDTNTGNMVLINDKFINYIELIAQFGSQTTADTFIRSNVDKHYDGGGASDATNIAYYTPYGVTDVSGTTITIDDALRYSTNDLLKFHFRRREDRENTGNCSGTYNGTYTFVKHFGSGRTEPTDGRPWGASHKLINTAYVYLRFRHNPDIYESGVPQIRCVIRGKKLFDPRWTTSFLSTTDQGTWTRDQAYSVNDVITTPTDAQVYVAVEAHQSEDNDWSSTVFLNDFVLNGYWHRLHDNELQSTWEWSDNWALACRDYLTSGNYYTRKAIEEQETLNSLYGIGVKENEIKESNIIEAANVSDEQVFLRPTALTVDSKTYDTETNIMSAVITGDQTDYYVKYEILEIDTGTEILTEQIVSVISEVIGGLPVSLLQAIPDFHAILPISIISSSYDSGANETTIKFKYNTDIDLSTLRLMTKRFTVNGMLTTSNSPISNLENMLAAGAGKLPFTQGQFLVIPGVFITPTITIGDNNLAGPVSIKGSLGSANLLNSVSGTVLNPANNWEESDFVKQINTTYIAEDGGYELNENVVLPFTTSSFDAQRLARIMLQRARSGVSVNLTCNLNVAEVPIGDFIKLTLSRFGWTEKIFSVTTWSYQEGKILLGLREETSAAYDWVDADLVPIVYAPSTEFNVYPDLSPITSFIAASGTAQLIQTGDGTIVPRVKLTWVAPIDTFNTHLLLYISIATDSSSPAGEDRTVKVNVDEEEFFIENVAEDDTIEVIAYVVYDDPNLEKTSISVGLATHIVVGKTQVPNNVTSLTSSIVEDSVLLSWNYVQELDFKHFEIREGGNNWEEATFVDLTKSSTYIAKGLFTGSSFTFRVKAIDTTENESATEANSAISITLPSPILAINNSVNTDIVNLFWTPAVKGSFSIGGYNIKVGGSDWDTASFVATVDSTDYNITDTWLGNRTYRIKTVDIYGNESTDISAVITTTAPGAMGVISVAIEADSVKLSWSAVTAGSFSVEKYVIRVGGTDWGSSTLVARINSTDYTIIDTFIGTRTYRIKAIDTYGNESIDSSVVITNTVPEPINAINSRIDNDVVNLFWTAAVIGTFSIAGYTIKEGGSDWDTASFVATVDSTDYNITDIWLGNRTYRIKTIDIYGNESTETNNVINNTAANAVSVLNSRINTDVVNLYWDEVTPGNFSLAGYIIKEGGSDWDTATFITTVKSVDYNITDTWIGSRTYRIKAVDIYGNESTDVSTTITNTIPNAILAINNIIDTDIVNLFWTAAVKGSFSVIGYNIKVGGSDWGTASFVATVDSTDYNITDTFIGARTYRIKAVDIYGNESTDISAIITTTAPAAIATINNKVVDENINIFWGEVVPGSFSLAGYNIRFDGTDFDDATQLAITNSTDYTIPDIWSGSRTFRIKTIDIYGNLSAETSSNITIVVPSAPVRIIPSPDVDIVGERVEISWTGVPGTFEIGSYDIRYDNGSGTFAAATKILITATDAFSRKVDWAGVRRFWIGPIDVTGVAGAELTRTVTINAPTFTTIIGQVVDNNVLLNWTDTSNTLPIDFYEVRRGDVYSSAEVIGTLSGLFFVIFETLADTYKYWITGVDTAGNFGTNNAISLLVNEPPDFVLIANYSDDFAGTKVNAFVNSEGVLQFPVNLTETWLQHFDNNSWTTIQQQIDAGFPIYIQPTPASGSYQFTYDHGTILNNLSVNYVITGAIIAGDPVVLVKLETSTINAAPTGTNDTLDTSGETLHDTGATFTTTALVGSVVTNTTDGSSGIIDSITDNTHVVIAAPGLTGGGDNQWEVTDNYSINNWTLFPEITGTTLKIFVSSFRFVRATTRVVSSAADNDLYDISAINLIIDVKEKSDSGSGDALASDTGSGYSDGTLVTLNKTFVDISSIIVTHNIDGGTADGIIAIYNFLDAPNPVDFRVLLYNDAGTRVDGKFSWTARGF